jgi:hypothetical protein
MMISIHFFSPFTEKWNSGYYYKKEMEIKIHDSAVDFWEGE